jgi:hypothetical protein
VGIKIFEKMYDNKDEEKISKSNSKEIYFYTYIFYKEGLRFECVSRKNDSENFREKRDIWFKKQNVVYFSEKFRETFKNYQYVSGKIITTNNDGALIGCKKIKGWILEFKNEKFFLVHREELGDMNSYHINIYHYETGIYVTYFSFKENFMNIEKDIVDSFDFENRKVKSILWHTWHAISDYENIN